MKGIAMWISVEDRLPEHGQYVLAYGPALGMATNGPKMDICCHDGLWMDEGGTELVNWERVGSGVTHWMELPAAPVSPVGVEPDGDKAECPKCNNNLIKDNPCPSCYGNDKTPDAASLAACPICHGTGHILAQLARPCSYCGWKGDIGPGEELRDIINAAR